MLLFKFPELKDDKETPPVNKNDLSLERHQHNGNIKSALSLCPDKNEKNTENDSSQSVSLPAADGDGDKAKNICIDMENKDNDVEVENSEENQSVVNVDENNKEGEDKYVHSLWKWPTGRSWLTKVRYVTLVNAFDYRIELSHNYLQYNTSFSYRVPG